MFRLSRPYLQTFQTQTLSATLQLRSRSGCDATVGATHVQTFQTLCPDFPDSKFLARLCNLSLNPDAVGPLAQLMSRLSRPYVQTFQTQNSRRDYAIWVQIRMGRDPWPHLLSRHIFCPDFPDSNSRRDCSLVIYVWMCI